MTEVKNTTHREKLLGGRLSEHDQRFVRSTTGKQVRYTVISRTTNAVVPGAGNLTLFQAEQFAGLRRTRIRG